MPPPPPLTHPHKARLIQIAREALQSRVRRGTVLQVTEPDARLNELRAVFATLTVGDRVRGCMGTPHADLPLYRAVIETVSSAATDDPVEAPIRLDEIAKVSIELSVLGPLVPSSPEALEPGRHGVLIQLGRSVGILLPQVATALQWTRQQMLEEACARGGLPRDAWASDAAHLSLFQAEVFSDYQVRLSEGT